MLTGLAWPLITEHQTKTCWSKLCDRAMPQPALDERPSQAFMKLHNLTTFQWSSVVKLVREAFDLLAVHWSRMAAGPTKPKFFGLGESGGHFCLCSECYTWLKYMHRKCCMELAIDQKHRFQV